MQDFKKVEESIKLFLEGMNFTGLDFEGTPERVARMWKEFSKVELPNPTICPLNQELDLVLFKNHTFWSFCPHHLLPVKYDLTIAYIPTFGKVMGASKPLRIANFYAKGLPLQEDIPGLVCNEIIQSLNPNGVGCIVKGEHLCMRMRGVKSPCSNMITPLLKGTMKQEPYQTLFLHAAGL